MKSLSLETRWPFGNMVTLCYIRESLGIIGPVGNVLEKRTLVSKIHNSQVYHKHLSFWVLTRQKLVPKFEVRSSNAKSSDRHIKGPV